MEIPSAGLFYASRIPRPPTLANQASAYYVWLLRATDVRRRPFSCRFVESFQTEKRGRMQPGYQTSCYAPSRDLAKGPAINEQQG